MNRFFTLLLAASYLPAVGQSEYCLEGTVWDDELGGCVSVILNSADINNDGCVQLGDLLDLLTAYGDCGDEESAWQCGDPLGYQGYEYGTVQIGEQCWFAQNLDSENFRLGSPIPTNLSGSDWQGTTNAAFAEYPSSSFGFLPEFGNLYNWYAILGDSLCPQGWHVSTQDDWAALDDHSPNEPGTSLKSSVFWDGTDDFGFNGLPGGYREGESYFDGGDNAGYWWMLADDFESTYNFSLSDKEGFYCSGYTPGDCEVVEVDGELALSTLAYSTGGGLNIINSPEMVSTTPNSSVITFRLKLTGLSYTSATYNLKLKCNPYAIGGSNWLYFGQTVYSTSALYFPGQPEDWMEITVDLTGLDYEQFHFAWVLEWTSQSGSPKGIYLDRVTFFHGDEAYPQASFLETGNTEIGALDMPSKTNGYSIRCVQDPQ